VGLAHLTIRLENESKGTPVQFNPTTYSIRKEVSWVTNDRNAEADRRANAPTRSFGGGGSRVLTVQLFFDVTESKDVEPDVRKETDRIVKMTRIDRGLGHPPVCIVDWSGAKTKDFPFKGTISSLNQQFTLFHESGRPLRALLDVSFIEFLNATDDQLENDPDLQTRTVRRGDTLAGIAAQIYGNPAKWREIALANGIEKPLELAPGTRLTLPKL
jgi:contractile injection system tube protein/LysM domain-containing protein